MQGPSVFGRYPTEADIRNLGGVAPFLIQSGHSGSMDLAFSCTENSTQTRIWEETVPEVDAVNRHNNLALAGLKRFGSMVISRAP